jgi:phosphatidylserine decarboxylase
MKRHTTSLLSVGFGKFASKAFPSWIQNLINRGYVKMMGLDMSEFQSPNAYKSLNLLFTRALKTSRPLPQNNNTLISSVDALITDHGEIIDGKAYQIKGMEYGIKGLFGTHHQEAVSKVEGGYFINFYLSPKDYHRYHMPMDLQILSLTHIPGKLYPVNFPLLRKKRDLFIENERVIIETQDRDGRCHILVLVGALNVGKMVVTFEEHIHTNSHIRQPQHYRYENLWLNQGDLFGYFEMGSTILLFSQKGSIHPSVEVNQKVKFAQPIGKIITKEPHHAD